MNTPDLLDGRTHEFMTVREVAELLRVKERKVYDLAGSDAIPCTRATGKLLFPTAAVRAWLANAGGRATVAAEARPSVILGSHDPLLEWAVRQSRSELAILLDGSLKGLERFRAGEGVASGTHLPDADGWNVATVAERCRDQPAALVHWAVRRRGLVVRPALAERIAGLESIVGLRFVPRPPESGSEILFGRLLDEAGLPGGRFTRTALAWSEQDAVLALMQDQADVAFGIEALARPLGLGFVPLVEECFDLVVDRRAWFEPPLQRLLDFCAGSAFRAQAERLAGYDISAFGEVRWNG